MICRLSGRLPSIADPLSGARSNTVYSSTIGTTFVSDSWKWRSRPRPVWRLSAAVTAVSQVQQPSRIGRALKDAIVELGDLRSGGTAAEFHLRGGGDLLMAGLGRVQVVPEQVLVLCGSTGRRERAAGGGRVVTGFTLGRSHW